MADTQKTVEELMAEPSCSGCKNFAKGVLLVEGKNDRNVIYQLCKARQFIKEDSTSDCNLYKKDNKWIGFCLFECGGVDKTLKELNRLIVRFSDRTSRPDKIGVVLDTDANLDKVWVRVTKLLKDYDYLLPKDPNPAGTVIDGAKHLPKIGVWFMPDNKNPGMIEDFIIDSDMFDFNSLTLTCKCVENAEKEGITTFKENQRSKAIVHTFLAWQDKPGDVLSWHIQKNKIKPNSENGEAFRNWLTRLFIDEP
ncbi:MAG: hypothetical protein HQK89_14540 [Nitrospirae bacterium]|nr:hypothetical protein [Nitrospirota bacterium]